MENGKINIQLKAASLVDDDQIGRLYNIGVVNRDLITGSDEE